MKNPCEKHLNVRASDGYCPICLLDENAQLRTQLDEARKFMEAFAENEADLPRTGKAAIRLMSFSRAWGSGRKCFSRTVLMSSSRLNTMVSPRLPGNNA